MSIRLALALASFLLATPALAQVTFELPDTGPSKITFTSEAPFETITGVSSKISGSFSVDLGNPGAVTGTVRIPVASLRTGNDVRDGHLQEAGWLDAAKHPDIVFTVESATFPAGSRLSDGGKIKGKGKGTLSIKGTKKAVEVPIIVSYHNASEKLKKVFLDGNVLRVKALFRIDTKEFGVVPPEHLAGVKVSSDVEIKADLTALNR